MPVFYDLQKMKNENKGTTAPGIAAFGLLVTGFAGIAHAFEFGTPLSLIASALSFGAMLYLLLN
jgi:hypothetical protein